jgi:hypothetical protein
VGRFLDLAQHFEAGGEDVDVGLVLEEAGVDGWVLVGVCRNGSQYFV